VYTADPLQCQPELGALLAGWPAVNGR
jgi:hypothetical protein